MHRPFDCIPVAYAGLLLTHITNYKQTNIVWVLVTTGVIMLILWYFSGIRRVLRGDFRGVLWRFLEGI